MMVQRCTHCVLPSTFRNIEFDSQGVCNYCHAYTHYAPQLTNWPHLHQLFEERLAATRGKGAYDCLLGLSGGKDSSYLLYTLVTHYKLRVLTVTFDNHFTNQYGNRNIEILTQKLGVEHFYSTPPWPLHQKLFRSATIKTGIPCVACAFPGYGKLHQIAAERNIPLIIHGRSRAQMFRELLDGSADSFLPFVRCNLAPYNPETVRQTAMKVFNTGKFFLERAVSDPTTRQSIFAEYFPNQEMWQQMATPPEFLGMFLFHQYDEKMMMDVLEKELGWIRPTSKLILTHNDCSIHEAAAHMSNHVLDYPLLAQELSVEVREGKMTRAQAIERLGQETCLDHFPTQSYEVLCQELEIAKESIPRLLFWNRCRHALIKRYFSWRRRLGGRDPIL